LIPAKLEFYDLCPYAYLGRLRSALAARTGAESPKPFLLGGVFKSLGGEPMASMSRRARA
jgi:2-hydroxychromene-2-carboxylate isomerase